MEKTIKTILEEMAEVVKEGKIQSPAWWMDRAMELSALWQGLKDEINKYDILCSQEIVALLEQGKKVNEAERINKAKSKNYEMLKYLEGRDRIIKEFVMLAKKRATIEDY